jgi:hypothetical protein
VLLVVGRDVLVGLVHDDGAEEAITSDMSSFGRDSKRRRITYVCCMSVWPLQVFLGAMKVSLVVQLTATRLFRPNRPE